MNIKDFDKYIEPKILSRGREYYNDGCIMSLEYDEDSDEWIAEISGSEDYTIIIKLSETGDILAASCDCPYDFGMYCKHQAAVFYSLRKSWGETPAIPKEEEKASENKPAKIKFEDMLKKTEKDELISFLTEYASENRKFKSEFMLRFADKFMDKSDIFSYARNLIKSSFTGLVHNGYIEYHDAPKVVQGAKKVLQIAEDEDNQVTAVSLCIIVLDEMLSAESNYNSEGYCYGMAEQATELLDEIVASFIEDTDALKTIFALLTAHISNDKINGFFEFKIDILEMFTPLCGIKYIREGVEKYIKIFETQAKLDYNKKALQELRYKIILEYDGKKSANAFINNNLENDKFREIAVDSAIKKKDYDQALALCSDAEKQDKNYRGPSKWRKLRYDIYETTGNTAEQKKLAYEFTADGKFEYYLKLKKLYAGDTEDTGEWHQILGDILAAVTVPYPKSIYPEILIHEKMKPELLEYCKARKNSIIEYHKHFLPDYKDEANEIFKEYLQHRAANAGDRKQYSEVCDIIKIYAKACGKKNADEIIRDFKRQNVKRPAFIDELGKIKI